TQGVCDVCAVDSRFVEESLEEIDSNPAVVTLHPHTLDDVIEDVRRVGEAVNRVGKADEVINNLRSRIDRVEKEIEENAVRRPRVAVVEWMEPVMIGSHWVPEMVESAGGEYGMAEAGERSHPREWDEVLDYAPEVLVVAPCGFSLGQTIENFTDLSQRPGWNSLPAVQDARVYAMDGHNYVNRPGPRLVDTVEYLAQTVHPEIFGTPPSDVAQTPIRIR
ncbi:MAG: ABC transporter substrate-binding protein, partial [Halobacteria archaeon]|nr:ABC transporter substrate-binding protein [Halobacteria archaeon]